MLHQQGNSQAISGDFTVFSPNCDASVLNYIVVQIKKKLTLKLTGKMGLIENEFMFLRTDCFLQTAILLWQVRPVALAK